MITGDSVGHSNGLKIFKLLMSWELKYFLNKNKR